MGIEPPPLWASLILSSILFDQNPRELPDIMVHLYSKIISSFRRKMYPEKLELKVEHQVKHASCLNLDITIELGIFVYKRKKFPFLLFACLTYPAIFHYHFSMVQYFQSFSGQLSLRKKSPYSALFQSAFFLRIQSECGKMREKCGPEKFRIRTLFTQCRKTYLDYLTSFLLHLYDI